MQNYTPKLFKTFKIAFYFCFSLGGILDFLQKSFITSNIGHVIVFTIFFAATFIPQSQFRLFLLLLFLSSWFILALVQNLIRP